MQNELTCSKCGQPASKFDVHCRTCGAELHVPTTQEQLDALGIELRDEEPIQLGGRSKSSVARDIGGAVAEGTWEGAKQFVRELFRPW
jgi:hypothetical protein